VTNTTKLVQAITQSTHVLIFQPSMNLLFVFTFADKAGEMPTAVLALPTAAKPPFSTLPVLIDVAG
jgi:hypothetical protein